MLRIPVRIVLVRLASTKSTSVNAKLTSCAAENVADPALAEVVEGYGRVDDVIIAVYCR